MNAVELAMRATSPACDVCKDHQVVTINRCQRETVPCPRCGFLNEKSYDEFRAAHMASVRAQPEVSQGNLSADEAAFYLEQTRAGHNRLTVLSWIEGRRYDPSKDEDFVKLVKKTVRKEREAFVE